MSSVLYFLLIFFRWVGIYDYLDTFRLDTKGTFHAKISTIKDRNDMDLTEAEDIKKRWQEYIKLYKKIFMTQITTKVWSLT